MDRDILDLNADLDANFEKITSERLREVAKAFLGEYEMPKSRFAQRVNLSLTTINRWLLDGNQLSRESLRQIFDFLVTYFPLFKEGF